MVVENVNEGVQNSSENPEVKQVEAQSQEEVSNQEQAQEEPQQEPVVEPVKTQDPYEKSISDMFDSGKREVTTNELLSAGFKSVDIPEYSFEVGDFKLSRLLNTNPYRIEKKQ